MLDLKWTPAAIWALRATPWREAASVDAEIQHFASTGEGAVARFGDDPHALRLRVRSYLVRLLVDPDQGVLTVRRVFRAG